MSEVPVRRTEWSTTDLLRFYAIAWRTIVGGEPSRCALALLWAQATLECARGGRSCWNFNVGNVMHFDGRVGDFHTLHGAPECFDEGHVPPGWKVQASNVACGPGQVSAIPAKGSRFRAYASFLDGCADKLRVLDKHWPRAILALQSATSAADAARVVDGLAGPPRYFTASAVSYAGQLRSLAAELLKTLGEDDWPRVHISEPPDSEPPDTIPETVEGRRKSSHSMPAVNAPIIEQEPTAKDHGPGIHAGEGEHTLRPYEEPE